MFIYSITFHPFLTGQIICTVFSQAAMSIHTNQQYERIPSSSSCT